MKRIEIIRKRIKRTRVEKGYSQYYVGIRLNMSQIAYHKLENGKTQQNKSKGNNKDYIIKRTRSNITIINKLTFQWFTLIVLNAPNFCLF